MTTDRCRLCRREAELQQSHILPAFAFRWLRESAAGAHLRGTDNPNLRVQDGIKLPWLCVACEAMFGKDEDAFARNLFHPYFADSSVSVRYSQWLLRFCTSVSWRVLRYHMDVIPSNELEGLALQRVSFAETAWRDYLLGNLPNPGLYEQHLLPLDQIESTATGLSPNINRYLMRAIHMDLCRGKEAIYTFSKLGRFVILGHVHEPSAGAWKGTKVHATEGVVRPSKYTVPGPLLVYMNEKAKSISTAIGSVSDRQQAKIETAFEARIDQYVRSDAAAAFLADVDHFGDAAFSKRK